MLQLEEMTTFEISSSNADLKRAFSSAFIWEECFSHRGATSIFDTPILRWAWLLRWRRFEESCSLLLYQAVPLLRELLSSSFQHYKCRSDYAVFYSLREDWMYFPQGFRPEQAGGTVALLFVFVRIFPVGFLKDRESSATTACGIEALIGMPMSSTLNNYRLIFYLARHPLGLTPILRFRFLVRLSPLGPGSWVLIDSGYRVWRMSAWLEMDLP